MVIPMAAITESLLTIDHLQRIYPAARRPSGSSTLMAPPGSMALDGPNRSERSITFSVDYNGDGTAAVTLRWPAIPGAVEQWVELHDRHTLDVVARHDRGPGDGNSIEIEGVDVNAWVPFRLHTRMVDGEVSVAPMASFDTLL